MKLLTIVFCLMLVGATASAQETAVATKDAPIYVRAQVTQTPLRVAAQGTRLRVVEDRGEWLEVEFNDPQIGLRRGFVQRQNIILGAADLTPMDLSVDEPASSPQPPRPEPRPRVSPTRPTRRAAPSGTTFPRSETAVGWSFVHVSNSGATENLPLGWNLSTATNLAPWLGLVGDAGGNYKSDVFEIDGLFVAEHYLLGGPRFMLRQSALVVPYAQFLLGVVRSDASFGGEREHDYEFAIQPGGGIDIGGPTLAARFEASWRRYFDDGPTNAFRFVVGVVIRSGLR